MSQTRNNIKQLSRNITIIENELAGSREILEALPYSEKKIIGITGLPGAGKSTITDALIGFLKEGGKKVAVICVDPSSPFNRGALLGDRIRMSQWYLDEDVFIRSVASRGALGGLAPKIIEITDLLKSSPFDWIIVETVGVGQSEIEIAGLADLTVAVLVPEAGDEVQTMKAGLMEIADIFVVNKSDRPGAELFAKNLRKIAYSAVPVIATVANKKEGIEDLYQSVVTKTQSSTLKDRRAWLLAEKAWLLIQRLRMKDIDKNELKKQIEESTKAGMFNLYKFVKDYNGGRSVQ